MPAPRPSFVAASLSFANVSHLNVSQVGKFIGGKVDENINHMPQEHGQFKNACPIRMSYVLNRTGYPIYKDYHYPMVSGADRAEYIYRVDVMERYLRDKFGKPDIKSKNKSDFIGKKGIIVFQGHGFDTATGHVTLWNGSTCLDECDFTAGATSGFILQGASLWILR